MDLIEIERLNPWWKNKVWYEFDPKLKEISTLPLKYKYRIELKKNVTIIYGPRQVGKTTWIKQEILDLTRKGEGDRALFLPCDGIFSAKELKETLIDILDLKPELKYLYLDEISFIDDWEQVIKYLIDNGFFKDKRVVVTGSSSINILRKSERLPGRDIEVKRFYPLTFREFVNLKAKGPLSYEELYNLFRRFLLHGGFLKAINEYEMSNSLSVSLLSNYSNAIDGELARVRKNPRIFDYILSNIILKLTNPISWSALAKNEVSQPTVSEYIEVGKQLMFINYIENLQSYEKAFAKNKKVYFIDPFLFWVAYYKVKEHLPITLDNLDQWESRLVENAVFSEFLKRLDNQNEFNVRDWIFYVKNRSSEIDFWVKNKRIEVKWADQIKVRDDVDVYLTKRTYDKKCKPVYLYLYELDKL